MTKANSLVMPWREAVPLNYPLTMKLVPKPTVVWRMCPYGGGFMNPDFMMQALVTVKSDSTSSITKAQDMIIDARP